MTAIIEKSDKIGDIKGTVNVPSSKSMSHRSIMCAALAAGKSVIKNVTPSQDIDATLNAMRALGAKAEMHEDANEVVIEGIGGRPQYKYNAGESVFCGESGSTLRFIIPLFSLTGAQVTFTGAGRLLQRPQQIYKDIFTEKGASFEQGENGITIKGALTAGQYTVDGSVSSQFISGLLFALPLLPQNSTVKITPPFESRSYVNLTISAMRDFGVEVIWQDDYTLSIKGNQNYTPREYTVEGDYSQAAFFKVLNAVTNSVNVTGLRKDSLQGDRAIDDILNRCKKPDGSLKATKIDLADCPDLGPILMVLGLFCDGETVIENAGRLRVKESDRIEAMQTEITKIGGKMKSDGGTIYVQKSALHSADNLSSHNDHRIAMAMAIAALAANIKVTINGAEAVNKSYPAFWQDIKNLSARVDLIETE